MERKGLVEQFSENWSISLFIVLCLCISIAKLFFSSKKFKIKGKHVLVTGGSSGIGKAIAKAVVSNGGHVTVIARDESKLKEAVKEIKDGAPTYVCQGNECVPLMVNWVSSDLTKGPQVAEEALKAVKQQSAGKSVDVLVNCAGASTPKAFLDLSPSEIEAMMRLNYFAAVDMTRAVLPEMMLNPAGGKIIFVSSQAGQVGLFGYTGYSASKFALRGFAEALQMEVHRENVGVGIAFPPDTDTPGFAEENKTKPTETFAVSQAGSVFTAKQVGESIVRGITSSQFLIWIGFDGWMLCNGCAGMSPVFGVLDAIAQVALASILRFVAFFYINSWYRVVRRMKQKTD